MATHEPTEAQAETDLTDRQGWLVVGVLVLSTLLIPAFIFFRGSLTSLGLTWMDTLVAMPMIPAVLFAAVGVWTAVRR